MSSNSFSILKNGIDAQLEIIQHDDSGFYNITKIAKMIMNIIKNKENDQEGTAKSSEKVKSSDARGIPRASSKYEKPADFFKISSTNENDQEGTVKSSEKMKSSDARGIPRASSKYENTSDFFKISSTNELIDECKKQTGLEIVHYELKKELLKYILECMFINYFTIIS